MDVVIGIGDFNLFPVRIAASDKMLLLYSSVTGRLMVSGKYLMDKKLNPGPVPPPPLEAVARIGKSFESSRGAPRARLRRPGCFPSGSSVIGNPGGGAAAQTAASSAAHHDGLLNKSGGVKACRLQQQDCLRQQDHGQRQFKGKPVQQVRGRPLATAQS